MGAPIFVTDIIKEISLSFCDVCHGTTFSFYQFATWSAWTLRKSSEFSSYGRLRRNVFVYLWLFLLDGKFRGGDMVLTGAAKRCNLAATVSFRIRTVAIWPSVRTAPNL